MKREKEFHYLNYLTKRKDFHLITHVIQSIQNRSGQNGSLHGNPITRLKRYRGWTN